MDTVDPEVALYVAKYLPMLLKTQFDFTDGNIDQALRTTFLAVDKQIVLEETADELQTLAGWVSELELLTIWKLQLFAYSY